MANTITRQSLQILKKCQTSSMRSRIVQKSTRSNILTSVYKDIPVTNLTVTDFVWQNLDRWSDKVATVCALTGRGYTYAQTYKMSLVFAASLRTKLKLNNDDTVAIILPNVPEYPCIVYGVLEAGCIVSMMNPAYTSHELKRQLELVNCKAIVTTEVSYRNIKQALKELKANIPVILIDNDNLPEGTIKFAEFAEDSNVDIDCLKAVKRSPKDIAFLPFSSGTTGLPKAVVLSHSCIVAMNQMIKDPEIIVVKETTQTHQAVLPAVLPFFHIFGFNSLMTNQMALGCKLVTMPYFKPEMFLETLRIHKAEALFIVPQLVLFLGKHPAVKPEHLESVCAVISGAARLSDADAAAVIDKNKNIIFRQGYGLTETSGVVSIGRNNNKNHSSVGHITGSSEVKIIDINTHEALAAGKDGEIWCRGPHLMKGYYLNDEATNEIITEDGWLKTGDIGKYDENKYLYITDRLKELIKYESKGRVAELKCRVRLPALASRRLKEAERGADLTIRSAVLVRAVKGFQVPPAELEIIIRSHPKVLDCAVLGIPDTITGETPKAFVVQKPGQNLNCKEILDYVNKNVAEFKRIKEVQFIDEIPKNPTGKVLRKVLKEKYC